ncbi:MAG TPA: FixH family protein [Verrucomicrobiae bacterium]|nr:FixH family protein [Verrucomicrobiae bacterium]
MSTPRRPILMIRLLALLLLAAATLLGAKPAGAHAMLLESVPADGAVLAQSPPTILLRFDEPVTLAKVEILDSTGKSAGAITVMARDAELHLHLPAALSEGTYLLSYRVTSLDSHVVGGTIVFSIGAPSTGGIAALQSRLAEKSSLWPLLSTIARLLLFIGLVGAAGGTIFHALVGRDLLRLDRETRRGTVALALLGLLAALAGIGIEGAALTDTGGAGILHGGTWRLGESTSLGLSLTVAAVALVVLIITLESARGKLALLALPAGFIALASLALTGHALTAGPLWLTAPVLAIHVLMAAFWLGALWPLWQAMGRRTPDAAIALLRRFSAIAIPAVALLVAAGATLAVLQIGRVGELLTTAYGIRLLSKLAFVALLLLLAALNRFWLTPALAAGRAQATHRLRASIGLEIGLGIAILAATSSLGEVPPPRALIAAAMAHDMTSGAAMPGFSVVTFADQQGGAGERGAVIEVTPAARGPNLISIHLFDTEGKPLTPQQVTIEISQPAAGVEPITHPVTATAPGLYRWEGAVLPLTGDWNLRLLVLISDFEEIRFDTSIPIR